MLTLDEVSQRFEEKPSRKTAKEYLATALVYNSDDMISDAEVDAIRAATKQFLQ